MASHRPGIERRQPRHGRRRQDDVLHEEARVTRELTIARGLRHPSGNRSWAFDTRSWAFDTRSWAFDTRS
jgi:hypothetical protein